MASQHRSSIENVVRGGDKIVSIGTGTGTGTGKGAAATRVTKERGSKGASPLASKASTSKADGHRSSGPGVPHIDQLSQLSQDGSDDLWNLARTPVLTVAEVAALLRCSPSTVRGCIKEGTIHGRRVGHEWRIPSSQFADIIPTASQATPLPLHHSHQPTQSEPGYKDEE